MSCNCITKIGYDERLNITAGTDVSLALRLHRDGAAFPVELSEGVGVFVVSSGGQRTGVAYEVGDGGRMAVRIDGVFEAGVYGIDVSGKLNGARWRAYGSELIVFTDETVPANGRALTDSDAYDVSLEVAYMPAMSIGSGQITIMQGENVRGSFNVNQSGDATIRLEEVGEAQSVDWENVTGKPDLTEKDPNVPDWAKVDNPSATVAEIERILYLDN